MSAGRLAPSIEAACARWAPRPAVTHGARTVSYGELWQQTLALSHAYRSLGVGSGDRVVCQLPACPEYFVSLGATWACGAVHVGIHRDSTGPELAALVERVQAAAVVYRPPAGRANPLAPLRAVRAARHGTVAVVHGHPPEEGQHSLADLLSLSEPPWETSPGPDDDATALLLLTSGTTGRGKAVMETRPALWAKMQFFADAVAPGPDDVHLMCLPVNHAFGLKLSLMALASGGRLVCLDRFSPAEAVRVVAQERVTILPGTPTHLALLLDAMDAGGRRPGSVRWAVSAAAPLPPATVEGVYQRLGAELLYVYGCSEGFLTQTTDRDEIRAGSVGARVFRGPPGGAPPDGSVAILHSEHDGRLPAGEVGEVAFGASRPVRYWGEPSAATDGWYRTGDLGRLDLEGRLFLAGRLGEVVNRGGLKVACGEVEAALAGCAGVSDCAVLGMPDPVLGEAICACVVALGATPPRLEDVRARLGEVLSRQKLPDELCLLEAIPRTAVGKTDRVALAALVAKRTRARVRG